MMIIISVVTGYLLCLLHFFMPQIIYFMKNKKANNQEDNKDTSKIVDEWLNGGRNQEDNKEQKNKEMTPEEVYREYMTGVGSKYGE